jgi:hypothetical protein
MMQNPAGLELRSMQTTEVAPEQSSMTIIMMPSEFVGMEKGIGEFGRSAAGADKHE